MPEYSVNLTFEGDAALAAQWSGYAKQKAKELGAHCAGNKLPYGSRWHYIDDTTRIHVRYIDGIQKAHIVCEGALHGIAFWPRTSSFPLGWGMPYIPEGDPGENVPMGTYGGQWPDIIANQDGSYPSLGHDYVARIIRGPTYGPKFKLQPADNLQYGNLVWYVGSDIYSTRKFNASWFDAPVNFTSTEFYVGGRAYTGPGVVLGFTRYHGAKIGVFMNNATKLETAYMLDDLSDSGTWTVIGSWTNPFNAFFDNSNSRPRYYKFSSDGTRAARLCAHSTTNHTALVWVAFSFNETTQEIEVAVTYSDIGLNGATINKTGSLTFDQPSVSNAASFNAVDVPYYIGYRSTSGYGWVAGWNWTDGSFEVAGGFYTSGNTAGIYSASHGDWSTGLLAQLPQGPYIGPFTDEGWSIIPGSCGNGFQSALSSYGAMFDNQPPDPDTPFSFSAETGSLPVADFTYTITWDFPSSENYSISGEAYIGVDFIKVTVDDEVVDKLALAVLRPRADEFQGYRLHNRSASSTTIYGTLFELGLTALDTQYQETLIIECNYADPHNLIIKTAGILGASAASAVGALADSYTVDVGTEWLVGNSSSRETTTYIGSDVTTLTSPSSTSRTIEMSKSITWAGVTTPASIERSACTKKFLDMDIAAGVYAVLEVTSAEKWPTSNAATPYSQTTTGSYDETLLFSCGSTSLATPETSPKSYMMVSTSLVNPATGGSTTTFVQNEQIRVYGIDYDTGASNSALITPAGVTETTAPGAPVGERSAVASIASGNYGFFGMFSGAQMVRYKKLYCLIMNSSFYVGPPYTSKYSGLTEFFTVDTNLSVAMSDAYPNVGVDTVTSQRMSLILSGNRFGVV